MSKELKDIVNKLLDFRSRRDWEQFHTPKDLAISIAIETAELLQEFQWKDDKEVREYLEGKGLESVREEVADIMIYLLLLCHETGVDIIKAVEDKIRINEQKYPADKAKGTAKKYDRL